MGILKKGTGFIFILLSGVFVALALWTVLPEVASKPCLLGYFAHCSFAPISTTILIILAIIFGLISWKILKRP